jgi:uncharacterized protein (TIGR03435 family)
MKRILWMIALIALCGSALSGSAYGQTITGAWQGTLKVGPQDLRIVIKLSLDDDKLKAVMYSLDQGGQAIPASAITQNGSTVKMTVAALNGTYEGKLSADANSIAGTWTQGQPLPFNLVRATPETAWTIPEPLPPPKQMPADAKPVFEVATIKPSKPEEHFSLLVNRSGMLNTTSTSLSDLLKFAYDLHPRQITGGPAWLESEKFDVTGKPDTAGIPGINQLKVMIQGLLADRFELEFHREKKDLSVYAITIAKTGIKMTKDENNPTGLPGFGGGPRGFNVRNSTMAEWANVLQATFLEQPVVDQTELGAARYDFILKWTPDATQLSRLGPLPPNAVPAADDPDAPPDLFTAFQQQLGLRLQSTKAPVDVLVIDHVEKPSANYTWRGTKKGAEHLRAPPRESNALQPSVRAIRAGRSRTSSTRPCRSPCSPSDLRRE